MQYDLTSVVGRRTSAAMSSGSTSAILCKFPANAALVTASGADARVRRAGFRDCHRFQPTAAATSGRLQAHATCRATASSPLAPAVSVKCRSRSAAEQEIRMNNPQDTREHSYNARTRPYPRAVSASCLLFHQNCSQCAEGSLDSQAILESESEWATLLQL
jgi:hypothetical protein